MNNAILLDYQERVFNDHSAVVVVEKSRRIGLSYAEAASSVLHSMATDGGDSYYISYDKDMTAGFIQDCAHWAKAFNAGASEIGEEVFPDPARPDKTILKFSMSFASGKQIQAFSSNPRNLRSKGRPKDRLLVDEAAFVDDLEEILKAAMAMTMWGGVVHIVSTHNGEMNPFNELVTDIRAGKAPYSLHRIPFDDAIRDGLYRRICEVSAQTWTEQGEAAWVESIRARYRDNAAEELDCIPSAGSGSYLSRVLIEACSNAEIPLLTYEQPEEFTLAPPEAREAETLDWCEEHLAPLLAALDPNLSHYFGEDFGRSNDLTVIWPVTELPGLALIPPFVLQLRRIPFEQQRQVLFYIVDRLPRFRHGALDARGNGQYLAEVAEQKYPGRITPVMLSQTWYRENTPRMKAHFEDRTWMVPRHADVLADFRAFRTVKGVAKIGDDYEAKGSDGKPRHADTAIAALMASFAAVQEGEPAAGETVGSVEEIKAAFLPERMRRRSAV